MSTHASPIRFKRIVSTLTVLGVTGILLYPPIGLPLFGLRALLMRRLERPRGWLLLWGLGLGPLAAIAVLQSDEIGLLHWLGTLAMLLVASSLPRVPVRALTLGGALALTVLSVATMLELRTLNRSFLPVAGDAITPFTLTSHGFVDRAEGRTGSASGFRIWRTPAGAIAPKVVLDLRLHQGSPGWDWLSGSQQDNLRPTVAGATRYTPSRNGAVIRRRALLTFPAGGHTFRGSVRLRAHEGAISCGRVALFVPGWGRGDGRDICTSPDGEEVTIEWQVPQGVNTPSIDLMLTGFGGGILDLEGGTLDILESGLWQGITPLAPSGVTISLSEPSSGATLAERQVVPTAAWTSVTLEGPTLSEANELLVALRIERGLSVDIARASLTVATGRTEAVVRTVRPTLWFGHPNLLGHTLALVGLLVAVGPMPLTLLTLPLTLSGLWLAGSRTALAVYLLFGFLFVLIRWGTSIRRALPAMLVAAVLAWTTYAALEGIGRFANAPIEATATRPAIWRAAVATLRDHPWLGNGLATPIDLANTTVNHAHNLILTLASWYGVTGLAAGLWLTVGLLLVGWRLSRWPGLLLAAAVLALNSSDYTLFLANIVLAVVVGINALQNYRPTPRSQGGSTGSAADGGTSSER